MRYYVTADTHGFYTLFLQSLREAGYYEDTEEKKIVLCGDLMDRGGEEKEMQDLVLRMLERDEIILVRGNHEDLFCQLVTEDEGMPLRAHIHNGTYQTALTLTGYDVSSAVRRNAAFAAAGRQTPLYQTIIPAMRDFYETEHFVFVHGWIPCRRNGDRYKPSRGAWRDSPAEEWEAARWYNGMDAADCGVTEPGKTIVCGHWHCSYGHWKFDQLGSEFGEDAVFDPYIAPGIIALDACTAHSGQVNMIVVEDD